jgi:uncharacterized protein
MFIKDSELSGQNISKEEMLNLANRFLNAMKNRDWESLRLIVTKDCIWRLPGSSMISGVAFGVDAVVKRASQTSCQGVSLLNILYGMNGFSLTLYNQDIKNDLIIDEYLTMVCILRDYYISGINSFLSDIEDLGSFFHY